MDGLNEMAGGGVGMVTALGMGTVFVCLILLYTTTRFLGAVMTPKPEPVEPASTSDAPAAATGAESSGDEQAILAAMVLALSRHRAARAAPASKSGGDDPWKIAGRLRMLRHE